MRILLSYFEYKKLVLSVIIDAVQKHFFLILRIENLRCQVGYLSCIHVS